MIDLPIEEIIIAGPGVDLGLANLTPEIAGMLVEMLLPGRAVGQPAIGTVEIFCGPKVVACHAAIMQRTSTVFQSNCLPRLMRCYLNP